MEGASGRSPWRSNSIGNEEFQKMFDQESNITKPYLGKKSGDGSVLN